MKNKLIIMCGIPGCGKSTYTENNATKDDIIVSRDEIRFSMLKDGDDYFAHEKEVKRAFYSAIRAGLAQGKTVWADATHITAKSRKALMRAVMNTDTIVEAVYIDTPFEILLERNDARTGLKKLPVEALYEYDNICEKPSTYLEPWLSKVYTVKGYTKKRGAKA